MSVEFAQQAAEHVSLALNEVCVLLNLAPSRFNHCGLEVLFLVSCVCTAKFKAICCSFHSTLLETFDKIVFLGRQCRSALIFIYLFFKGHFKNCCSLSVAKGRPLPRAFVNNNS